MQVHYFFGVVVMATLGILVLLALLKEVRWRKLVRKYNLIETDTRRFRRVRGSFRGGVATQEWWEQKWIGDGGVEMWKRDSLF